MKITTFNPLIVTAKAEEAIKLFEDLGFEKRHAPSVDIGTGVVTTTRMKNADGFYVDIADIKTMPQDKTLIRMNVDNFDEAYDILTKNGCTGTREKPIETETNKSIGMKSSSGLTFDLCQHIKE